MRKIQVGLLGLGTVGMGVYKLLRKRAETMDKTIGAQLEIKKILVHNKNKKREGVDETLLTDDWKEIIEDDEIQIVKTKKFAIKPTIPEDRRYRTGENDDTGGFKSREKRCVCK